MNRRTVIMAIAASATLRTWATPARAQWSPAPLVGTAWTLQGVAYPDGTSASAVPGRYTVSFGTDGQASLRIDCNSGVAGWSVHDSTITFSGVASTLMLCPNEDPLEQQFGQLLTAATWWSLDGGTLTITTPGGAAMTFTRTVMTTP